MINYQQDVDGDLVNIMSQSRDAQKIIKALETGNYYADCPCCDNPVLLKRAGLFYLDDFPPEAEAIYNDLLLDIKGRKEYLRKHKKSIISSSEKGAKATNTGFLSERIAPSLKDFPFNRNDSRSLFDPIDYLVFEGLSKTGKVAKIFFVEIKTGKARLQPNQKNIKTLVEKKKVHFDTYKHKTNQ